MYTIETWSPAMGSSRKREPLDRVQYLLCPLEGHKGRDMKNHTGLDIFSDFHSCTSIQCKAIHLSRNEPELYIFFTKQYNIYIGAYKFDHANLYRMIHNITIGQPHAQKAQIIDSSGRSYSLIHKPEFKR